MGRTRLIVIALVALALSAILTFWLYRSVRSRVPSPESEEMIEVVVASQRLGVGDAISEQNVRSSPWPKSVQVPGLFTDVSQVVGRGVIVPVQPNEPILESKLAPTVGLTSTIPEGMRAVAIKVNDVIGVAGFVLPGTRVDVILTGQPTNRAQEDVAKIILENVPVLTAGQALEQDEEGKPMNVQVVTLMVTPEEAQKLALGSVDGRLQLALRNPLDLEKLDPDLVTKTALYSGRLAPVTQVAATRSSGAPRRVARIVPTPVPTPPPPTTRTIEVELIQGAERSNLVFEEKTVQPDSEKGGN